VSKNPITRYVSAISRMFTMLSVKKSEVALLIGQVFLLALFEGIGIGLLYPVLSYIENPGDLSGPTPRYGRRFWPSWPRSASPSRSRVC